MTLLELKTPNSPGDTALGNGHPTAYPFLPLFHALKGFSSLQSGPLADFLGFLLSLSLKFLLVKS